MKKAIFVILGLVLGFNFMYAQDIDKGIEDNTLVEKINEKDDLTQELNQNFKFMVFTSCQDMEVVLEDFVGKYWNTLYSNRRYYDDIEDINFAGDRQLDEVMLNTSVPGMMDKEGSAKMHVEETNVSSSSTEYSTTNLQVKGVEEPEILKVDGDYLYYYNSIQKKLYIIKSPLNRQNSSININSANVIKILNIPQSFTNVQLFVTASRLVIVSQRQVKNAPYDTLMDTSNKTDVIIYNTNDKSNPVLVKLFDTNGYYHDARMIGGELYLITKTNLRFKYAVNQHKVFGVFNVTDVDMDAKDILPTSVEITKKTNTNVSDETKKIEGYDINVERTNCNEIFYLFPNKETISRYSVTPNFAIVTKVDVENYENDVVKKVIFGDVSQIHMSKESLYFTNHFYTNYGYRCPMRARCIRPMYYQGENSLLHKFTLDQVDALKYVDSTIVPGTPLNQYSMSEDDEGYFRILTKTSRNTRATNLYVLDPKMDLYGSLENIEPGEDFKSSRYIGDKLYLVTFQQIDPLFVVDIKDKKDPKIIGELKMPGYSTYLHPYDDEKDGVQYLIGLGIDTNTNQWGGVTNGGIKLDFYKIDYNLNETSDSKCRHLMNDASGEYSKCVSSVNERNIRVELLHTKVLGDKGSWTEALENPRMFVWDKTRKVLILPAMLKLKGTEKRCQNTYWMEGDVEIQGEKCEDVIIENKNFAGLKGYTIDKENGIIESITKDYNQLMKGNNNYYDQRQFRNQNFRVGYLGDVIYSLNNMFGHFFVLGNDGLEKYIYFDKSLIPEIEQIDSSKVYNVEELVGKTFPENSEIKVKGIMGSCIDVKVTDDYEGPGGGCFIKGNNNTSLHVGYVKITGELNNKEVIAKGKIRYCGGKVKEKYFCGLKDVEIELVNNDNGESVGGNCNYNPPAPGEVVCQMYCGKRWVLNKDTDKCSSIEVSAACSCPGYDTQEQCERNCE